MRITLVSAIFQTSLRSATGSGVRQQSHLAGVLDSLGELTLFLHGNTGDTTGTNLAAIGDELAQQGNVLVIDLFRSLSVFCRL